MSTVNETDALVEQMEGTAKSVSRKQEFFEKLFPRSEAETSSLQQAPFNIDEALWFKFSFSLVPHLVRAFELGEIEQEDALDYCWHLSFGCHPMQRVELLGFLAASIRQIGKRIHRNARKPKVPTPLRQAAVDLVLMFDENHGDRGQEHCIKAADWLHILGIHVAWRTLQNWVNERKRADLEKPRRRGPKPRQKLHE